MDEIPTERLYDVPTVVIDVSSKIFLPGGKTRSDYAMTKEDIMELNNINLYSFNIILFILS